MHGKQKGARKFVQRARVFSIGEYCIRQSAQRGEGEEWKLHHVSRADDDGIFTANIERRRDYAKEFR